MSCPSCTETQAARVKGQKDKGHSSGMFWAIFQFDMFVASAISLATNIGSRRLSAVSTSTYIAFLITIFLSIASSWLILPPTTPRAGARLGIRGSAVGVGI